jgi:hypothetical protein
MAEFSFICPNQPAARESILRHLDQALAGDYFQGVFLDRIRFPSPADDLSRHLGCFCKACQKTAAQVGLDLPKIQQELACLIATPAGKIAALSPLLATSSESTPLPALEQFLEFRRHSITALVGAAADLARSREMQVGLDCFSPTLTRMVGQDLRALAQHGDWIKVMTYARAYGPASLPFEILGLIEDLMRGTENEIEALNHLQAVTGWPLPTRRAEIRRGKLPAQILTEELQRGRAAQPPQLFAGIELVEMPGIAELNSGQIAEDARAVRAAAPDGIVFSWDLQWMSLERLREAQEVYLS